VQCFGNFDVFLPNGEHVRFERSRSKEIFAYLVHRQGTSCTIKELAAALFEDEPYDAKQQNYMQQLTHALMKSLRAVGAEETVVKGFNALAVNPELIDCDYYRFKELDAGAVNSFQNEYMSQYSWAEFFLD
jgi:two-component SAPR family response regulator